MLRPAVAVFVMFVIIITCLSCHYCHCHRADGNLAIRELRSGDCNDHTIVIAKKTDKDAVQTGGKNAAECEFSTMFLYDT